MNQADDMRLPELRARVARGEAIERGDLSYLCGVWQSDATSPERQGLAAAVIFVSQRRLVWSIAYTTLRNWSDADDAASEVWIRFLRSRGRIADCSKLRTWLARVAYTRAIERIRGRKADRLEELVHDHLDETVFDATEHREAIWRWVESIVTTSSASLIRLTLDPAFRTANDHQIDWERLEAHLGTPKATLQGRLKRAMAQLKSAAPSAPQRVRRIAVELGEQD